MKFKLPHKKADKRFRLFIADAEDAPPDHRYSSLKAALRALDDQDERWQRLAWIIEYQEEPSLGGIPLARDIVHVRYGVRTEYPQAGS